jgi:hypothetical protein
VDGSPTPLQDARESSALGHQMKLMPARYVLLMGSTGRMTRLTLQRSAMLWFALSRLRGRERLTEPYLELTMEAALDRDDQ